MKNWEITKNMGVLLVLLALSGYSTNVSAVKLVNQEINDDRIATESDAGDDSEAMYADDDLEEPGVVLERRVVRKKRRSKPRYASAPVKRVIVEHDVESNDDDEDYRRSASRKRTAGSALDEAMNQKMEEINNKVAEKVVGAVSKAVDKIRVVDEDEMQAQQPAAPMMVQDQMMMNASAPANNEYIGINNAEAVSETTPKEAKDSKELNGNVGIFPLFGFTSMNSDRYDISSKYTAGLGVEVEVARNIGFVGSYTYSQYDIRLATVNPYYNYYTNQNPYYANNGFNSLNYNQNVIDAGIRFYLLPKESRFRIFLGTGLGYNKGFLNYPENVRAQLATNPYNQYNGMLDDYEVSSFLGQLATGGEIKFSESFALGAQFKYNHVLSSKENTKLNNGAFLNYPYYNQAQYPTNNKDVVGGSIADESFYSILGNVKVIF